MSLYEECNVGFVYICFTVVFWKAVEMLEKMIAGTKYNSNVIGKSGLLPLLVGILLQCETKVDYLLELIEELTFVVPMTSYESYAQKVFKYIINILTDAQFEVNAIEVIRTIQKLWGGACNRSQW